MIFLTGTPDCYTGVRTHFSIIGRNIENVKITDNWKNTFTKRLLTFLTVEKCGKLLLKFVKNSFTSTNLKRLIMLKWLNCITECLHFMTISWIQMNLEGSQSISGKIIYELFLALKCKRFDHKWGDRCLFPTFMHLYSNFYLFMDSGAIIFATPNMKYFSQKIDTYVNSV